MGNQDSKIKLNTSSESLQQSKLFTKLDIISAKLILNTNFQTLKNLQNDEYCNKITILTSDILNKQLNPTEITYLNEKINNNSDDNTSNNQEIINDKIYYFKKDNIENIGELNPQKKHLLCVGISKFYVDIARLYSSILNVINPVYIFKDDQGNTIELPFEEYKMKYGYGKEKKNAKIIKKNLCIERLNSLIIEELEKTNILPSDISMNIVSKSREKSDNSLNTLLPKYDITSEHLQKLEKITGNTDTIKVDNPSLEYNILNKPKTDSSFSLQNKETTQEILQSGGYILNKYSFSISKLKKLFDNPNIPIIAKTTICNLNQKKDGTFKSNLFEEHGIPNLKFLYYDIFDYKTGKYIGMSDDVKEEYIKDVELLYKAFTGNKIVPNNVKDFTDIPLNDYKNMDACINDKGPIYKTYVGTLNEKVFKDFATKLAYMYNNIQNSYIQLEKILDELFVYKLVEKVNNMGQKYMTKDIVIHPALNVNKLKQLEILTKNIIIKHYIQCEQDFLNAFESFEILLQSKIIQSTQNRLKSVEKTSNKIALI